MIDLRPPRRVRSITRLIPCLVVLASAATTVSASDLGWFVAFENQLVAPVQRSNTSQLMEVGVIDTDGFSELVFSLGGEFKEGIPSSGVVGAVLIPDLPRFDYLLRTEGQFVFPLEVQVGVDRLSGAIFISEETRARIAFPRYRIYLYNETGSGASVSLYLYRTR